MTCGSITRASFASFWLRSTADGADPITHVMPRFHPGKEFKRVIDAITFNRN